jgi:hypothetical protein
MTRKRTAFLLALAVVSLGSGCSTGGDDVPEGGPPPPTGIPTAPLPPMPEAFQEEALGYTDELETTFIYARTTCREEGLAKLAAELDAPADTPRAVAHAYSQLAKPGAYRNATYSGCLRGLINLSGDSK